MMWRTFVALSLCIGWCFGWCPDCRSQESNQGTTKTPAMNAEQLSQWAKENGLSTITLGAGCFWCTEAAFIQIKGVEKVISGYSNGHVVNPTYEQVCNKKTGHIEVAQIFYDPKVVSLEKILEVFFVAHDPTTMDRQGADEGPQYRSAILFTSEEQKQVAIKCLEVAGKALSPAKIVTVLEPLKSFYPAEDYHQNYYKNNPNNGYCRVVVREKVKKVQAAFADLIKPE